MLDPAWEDELRQGQEAEGEAGSVDAELALVHLLRHVREPDALAPDQLDNLWKQIEAEVAPTATPWWKRAWLLWAAPVAVTAAVLLVIVLPGDGSNSKRESTVARHDQKAEYQAAPAPAPAAQAAKDGERAGAATEEAELADEGAAAGAAPAAAESIAGSKGAPGATAVARSETAQRLEKSFATLAPYGHASIRVSVDKGFDDLRGQLLADAKGGG